MIRRRQGRERIKTTTNTKVHERETDIGKYATLIKALAFVAKYYCKTKNAMAAMQCKNINVACTWWFITTAWLRSNL